jgi:GNAT superfamily N-acetyltransferase
VHNGLTPALVKAWLEARSVARQLPPPVDDYGGFRVNTCSSTEIARWVFPTINSGLVALGQALEAPRHFIKLCGTAAELCAALPQRWRSSSTGYFMTAGAPCPQAPVPDGYAAHLEKDGRRVIARVTYNGGPAASGYGAENKEVFIYDRIETQPLHRRRGLGKAVMGLLRSARSDASMPEVLVATEDGSKLYEALGWRTLSAYSTACIVSAG